MKKVEVVAAVIYFGERILCVQRPENKYSYISKKYEFPGGKIEANESMHEALKRELLEELNISADIKELFLTVVHPYPDFELTMHSFVCEVQSQELTLNEHIDYKWLTLAEMPQLDWAAADVPIVNKLVTNG
jgi:8-oxo-dGTP diphosphatase